MATDGLEDKLQQILNDPDSMAQILSLAQSFGMSPEPPKEQAEPPAPPQDDKFLKTVFSMMQQARKSDSKQEALLAALKPYLAPERRWKIDQALQIARVSHLAGAALGQFGGKGGK